MNYLNNHEIAKERMQQFINDADEIRNARRLSGEKPEQNSGFMSQLRNAFVRTLSTIIR